MSLKHKVAKLYFKLRGVPTCEELDNLSYDFLDGNLDAKMEEAIEKHIRLCPPCVHFMDSYRRIKEVGAAQEVPSIDPAFKLHLKKMFES